MGKYFFILCILCASYVISPFYVHSGESVVNKIVASVAGEPITYYDVLVLMHPQLKETGLRLDNSKDAPRIKRLKEAIINDLVNNILIEQEAFRYNVKITDQEVDGEMRKIARENKTSVDVLEQQIILQGSNIQLFKKNIKDNLLRQRMIGSFVFRKIVVTAQEVEEYYKNNMDSFQTDSVYVLEYIKFSKEEEAKNSMNTILSGSTQFATERKRYAKEQNGIQSGVLGEFTFSELAPAWQHLLQSASTGQTVGPLYVDKEYFLLYVLEKKEGKALPLEDVYTTIEGKLRDSKFSKQYALFIDTLKSKADIKLYN